MTLTPLVSILINNYNYARFLREATESALGQAYRAIEVIVVDDGSTDDSIEVIESFGNRIRVIRKANGGQASAFNAGFTASTGEIICFLDSDDLFLPHKVEQIAAIFRENPDVEWCFDTPEWFGGPGRDLPNHSVRQDHGLWDGRSTLAKGKSPHIPTATSGLSFRRSHLSKILPMPEIIRITSDNYLKLAALATAPGWIDSRTLTKQRIHGDNAYTNRKSGKTRLMGRTELLTGMYLQEKFSSLDRVAFKMFCRGVASSWATGGIDQELRSLVSSHIQRMSTLGRVEAYLRMVYWGTNYKWGGSK